MRSSLLRRAEVARTPSRLAARRTACCLALSILTTPALHSSPDEAAPLSLDAWVTRRLAAGTREAFQVSLQAGESLEIRLDAPVHDGVPRAWLTTPAGARQAVPLGDDWSPSFLVRVTESGSHVLVVENPGQTASALSVWGSRAPFTAKAEHRMATLERLREARRRESGRDYCSLGVQLAGLRAELRTLEDSFSEGSALVAQGYAEYVCGRTLEALPLYEEAESLAGRLGLRFALRAATNDVGVIRGNLGDRDGAIAKARLYIELLERDGGNASDVPLAFNNLALPLAARGDFDEAIQLQLRAVDLWSKDAIAHAWGLMGLGTIFDWFGDRERARAAFEESLARWNEAGGGNLIETRLAQFLARENPRRALDLARRSIERTAGLADLAAEGRAHAAMAIAEEALGHDTQALEHARVALERLRVAGWPVEQARILLWLASHEARAGKADAARSFFEQALKLGQAAREAAATSQALLGLARLDLAAGRTQEALHHAEQALALAEAPSARVPGADLRTAYLAARRGTFELEVDALAAWDREEPSSDPAVKALEASERGRSRALLENLGRPPSSLGTSAAPGLAARERALESRIDGRAARLLQISPQANEALVATIEDALAREVRELDDVRARRRHDDPAYRELTDPRVLNPDQMRALLDRDTTALVYYFGARKLYAWIVTREAIRFRVLGSRSEIEAAARELFTLLQEPARRTSRPRLRRLVRDLSERALAPLRPDLSTPRLLVVPDGALQLVPPVILQLGDDPLLRRFEIAVLPSLSVLGRIREIRTRLGNAPRRALIVVDPVTVMESQQPNGTGAVAGGTIDALPRSLADIGLRSLPRLASARAEGEALRALLPRGAARVVAGFEASRDLLSEPLTGYGLLHFATHGLVNDRHAELSGLVLSLYYPDGRPRNGFLRIGEVAELRLAAPVVTLSACRSGLGNAQGGEGLASLARAFFQAGARAVVASHWAVRDDATRQLMDRFYHAWLVEGQAPAAALRRAQLAMLDDPAWSDARFWSAFSLLGDGS